MRRGYRLALLGVAAGICLAAVAGDAPGSTSPRPVTRGYLITYFTYAMHFDPDFEKVCPNGWFPSLQEAFVAALPEAERTRLEKPENAAELGKVYREEGSEGHFGEDVCSNVKSFRNDPRYPLVLNHSVQSKFARGLDLDADPGRVGAPRTCKHESFQSVDGRSGIDNQMFRALGCARTWRGGNEQGGDNVLFEMNYMEAGENAYLLEISGITDLRNDAVEVRFYSTGDVPRIGLNRRFIANQTFRPKSEPRYTNVMRGKIVDGVLTTEPIDALRADNHRSSRSGTGVGPMHDRIWRDARFQLTFNKDGSLKGLLGGYQRPEEILHSARYSGKVHATIIGVMCPMEYKAMAALADGYPDPKTGECTQISSAYDVVAVPAFIVHPAGAAPAAALSNR